MANEWPAYISRALKSLAPPERLKVSEWAERYRYLDDKTSAIPGRWSNAVTPYLVGIMDAINEPGVQEIAFCKPTQVGATEVVHNILGYCIMMDPGSAMIVYPTDPLAASVSKNRIQPMLRSTPELRALFHEDASQLLELQCDSMIINLAGTNSPVGLSSHPRRYVLMDEVDKYPAGSAREGTPIKLARERTKTFDNRKLFTTSTPTLKTGNIWKAMEDADVIRHYYVPCPHCGQMIELLFKQIRFPEGGTYAERARDAMYFCQHCDAGITDAQKIAALRGGYWRVVSGSNDRPVKVAFWINTLYSPFVSWSNIVREFLSSKDDPASLQNFVNSWLAEPWEDTRISTSDDMVLSHQTESPKWEVPEWTQLITGGVDVQEQSLYWTIRAWGSGLTSQCVAHGQAFSLKDIVTVMNQPYRKANGEEWLVELCLVDSGDQTDTVYEFCFANQEWATPVKGSSRELTGNNFRISKIDRSPSVANGYPLVFVDGDKYKTTIASRLNRPVGVGSWMVHAGCDMEYARQVTAEHRVADRSGRLKWQPKTTRGDNHYLDAEVYAFAAADVLGVRSLDDGEEEPAEASTDKRVDEEWISTDKLSLWKR